MTTRLEYVCIAAVFILCGSADWIASAVAGVVA